MHSGARTTKQPKFINNFKDLDENAQRRLLGSKRSVNHTVRRGYSQHPSEAFVPMELPKAQLRQKGKDMNVAEQIDYMLRIFLQARAADKGQLHTTSNHMINNQLLAQNLIRARKSHGLSKSVAQGFLKKILTPYGSLYKMNKVPLQPIKMIVPSQQATSRLSSTLLNEDSVRLNTEEEEIVVAPEKITKMLQDEVMFDEE